jgi:AraC family transcriptional activator of pobA
VQPAATRACLFCPWVYQCPLRGQVLSRAGAETCKTLPMTINELPNELPWQHLIGDGPIQVIPLAGFSHETSHLPHRHDFMMLLWVNSGTGNHSIDFKAYDMTPNRLFFIHRGQVHSVASYAVSGYLILFNETVVVNFLSANREEELRDMLDHFSPSPFVDLDDGHATIVTSLCRQLDELLQETAPSLRLAQHYILLILLYASQQYRQQHPEPLLPLHLQTNRKLKTLIETYFIQERQVGFYARQLGMDSKKLNLLTQAATGRTVHQWLSERLLIECKLLLVSSALTIKEIAYRLEFSDMAQFSHFMKKETGLPPLEFRRLNSPG